MQLFSDSGDTDRAIKELERTLPIEALKSVLQHRKTAELRRVLALMKSRQLVQEANAA